MKGMLAGLSFSSIRQLSLFSSAGGLLQPRNHVSLHDQNLPF
jgi:hypothetical protein